MGSDNKPTWLPLSSSIYPFLRLQIIYLLTALVVPLKGLYLELYQASSYSPLYQNCKLSNLDHSIWQIHHYKRQAHTCDRRHISVHNYILTNAQDPEISALVRAFCGFYDSPLYSLQTSLIPTLMVKGTAAFFLLLAGPLGPLKTDFCPIVKLKITQRPVHRE